MKLTDRQQAFIQSHEKEDVLELALRYKGEDISFLLAQIAGRQAAEKKIPTWYRNRDLLYPQQLSLEQASSELTARYKASLVDGGDLFVDLTGGMGIDFSFLAPHFRRAHYVEKDEQLCHLARHNFAVLGMQQVEVHQLEGEAFLQQLSIADLIYLDPARRDAGGRKVFRIEECSPDLSLLAGELLEKAERVMIKYSPMLDISLAVKTLRHVKELHVVSVENECKELLFLLGKETVEPLYHAVNIHRGGERELFTFTPGEEQQEALYSKVPGRYLYEPNASILKAGGFNVTAHRYNLQKLHKHSHLYTGDRLVDDFPGRIFQVEEWFGANRKEIRRFAAAVPKTNITVRNYPHSVAEIRKRWGLTEGGDNYLFATTLNDGQKVWISCSKL